MSRTQSQGLEYFPLQVDFFSDPKIKILKARFGADGVTMYLYLLCQIYREGYFLKADEDFFYTMSDDLGMSLDKVRQVMTFFLRRSMFDEQLLRTDTILTSTGIQERWQRAISARATKTPIMVDKFWLLKPEETRPFIRCTLLQDSSEKKGFNSEKKCFNSEKKDIKESKVKESKRTFFARTRVETDGTDDQGREEEVISEPRKKFFLLYEFKDRPSKNAKLEWADFDVLLDRFSKSSYLRETKSWAWVRHAYQRIVSGEFEDFPTRSRKQKPKDEQGCLGHNYSSEELQNVFSDSSKSDLF